MYDRLITYLLYEQACFVLFAIWMTSDFTSPLGFYEVTFAHSDYNTVCKWLQFIVLCWSCQCLCDQWFLSVALHKFLSFFLSSFLSLLLIPFADETHGVQVKLRYSLTMGVFFALSVLSLYWWAVSVSTDCKGRLSIKLLLTMPLYLLPLPRSPTVISCLL